MAYFKNKDELERVVGGFLQNFPRLEPLLRELTSHKQMLLKLELRDPELSAEIDFEKSPLVLRFGTNADGTIGMACSADDFHRLLLGLLPIGAGVNHKRIFLRGSVAKLMSALPLFYVAPAVYPFYLESIGRRDLIFNENFPPLHGESETEDAMNRIISKLAFAAGYALGLVKSKISPRVDVIAALEAMGKGLLRSGLAGQAQSKD